MTGKQLKMWSRETVRRNRIEPAERENLSNSQKCLITLHIVGWVIIKTVTYLLRSAVAVTVVPPPELVLLPPLEKSPVLEAESECAGPGCCLVELTPSQLAKIE